MMLRRILPILTGLILITFGTTSASFGGAVSTYTDHDKVSLSATKYQHAGGSTTLGDHRTPSSRVTYLVNPWNGNCNSTHSDQVCDATSLPKCQQEHPDDKQNKWRPFDIFISHDGDKTYPTYPNNADIPKVCLNTIALDQPARAPLDPRLVYEEATKLVPKGEWHPEPDGQAVVNKPVIVTVETNKDQAFKPFTLLGYHVEVKAHIDSYEWHYGDGTPASAVDWPGQNFNSSLGGCTASSCTNYVNHTYNHAGAYSIQLTLHWKATYRVDGGNWQPVPGNITTTSPTQNMTILNAHSQLVTGN